MSSSSAEGGRAVARRNATTVAPQALLMLNSSFVMEQAALAAQRALASDALTDDERILEAFRETLGREPSDNERQIARAAVAGGPGGPGSGETAAARLAKWQKLYQGLFGCIDFRYLE